MITIPQFPSYYRNDSVEKQLETIHQYLNNLKTELDVELNEIHLESLDSSIRETLSETSNAIKVLSVSIERTQELLATNYAKVSEIQDNGITVGTHTYTEQTVTIDGQTIHYLGYED